MRIMVLGANGYLGNKVCGCLLSEDHSVVKVVRHMPEEYHDGTPKTIYADIGTIQKELNESAYDWIVNCAAVYEKKGTQIHQLVDTNLVFALQVLDCAVECGVKKFLTIDTGLPKEFNLYSFTKKQFAEFGKFYAAKYGITFFNVALEMFYGEDEPRDRFLVRCCHKMLEGEELLLTQGTQKRDVIYIGDVCNAIRFLLTVNVTGFQNIPLGSGTAVSIRELLEYMHTALDSGSRLVFGAVPSRKDEPDCVADMGLLSSMGFCPGHTWKSGIAEFCRKMRDSRAGENKKNKEG